MNQQSKKQRNGIKQRIAGGSVSAVQSQEPIKPEPSSGNPNAAAMEIREGDWKAYQLSLQKCRGVNDLPAAYRSVNDYRRACALAYLGKRAQIRGGIYNSTKPHIMTPHFVADLEADNKSRRFGRYPWLETLTNLLAYIERLQDEMTNSNVITLVQPGQYSG
jgi:hypothetical protein